MGSTDLMRRIRPTDTMTLLECKYREGASIAAAAGDHLDDQLP